VFRAGASSAAMGDATFSIGSGGAGGTSPAGGASNGSPGFSGAIV
jgi:hypothetical protein